MNEQMKELLDAVKNLRDVVCKVNAETANVSSVTIYSTGGASIYTCTEQNLVETEHLKSMGVDSFEANFDGISVSVTVK